MYLDPQRCLKLAGVLVAVVVEGGAVPLLDALHPGTDIRPRLAIEGAQP